MSSIVKFTEENIMQYILMEFPEFYNDWQKHLKYWENDLNRSIAQDISEFEEFALKAIEDNNKSKTKKFLVC